MTYNRVESSENRKGLGNRKQTERGAAVREQESRQELGDEVNVRGKSHLGNCRKFINYPSTKGSHERFSI